MRSSKRLASIVICSVLLLALSGCGTFKPITSQQIGNPSGVLARVTAAIFTKAAMDDFIWSASVTAPSVDIAMELANDSGDPNIQAGIAVAIATHLIEPNGPRILRLTLTGETKPRIFICRATMALDCEIPINTGVRVWAKPVSVGNLGVLIVDRISKTN